MKKLVFALSALSLLAGSVPSLAADTVPRQERQIHQVPGPCEHGQAETVPRREGTLHQV